MVEFGAPKAGVAPADYARDLDTSNAHGVSGNFVGRWDNQHCSKSFGALEDAARHQSAEEGGLVGGRRDQSATSPEVERRIQVGCVYGTKKLMRAGWEVGRKGFEALESGVTE